MEKKKRYRLVLLLLFAISIMLFGCGESGPDPNSVEDPTGSLDFSTIPDGTHRGTFTYGAFNYIVDVVAEDGEVIDIIVIQNKDNAPSIEAESVLSRIVEAQSLEVDGISGATVSSRSLMKAVENALKRALN